MRPRCTARRSRGFTLVEAVVAVLLVSLVVCNLLSLVGGPADAVSARAAHVQADLSARRVLDRVALAVIGSSEDYLFISTASPGSESALNYLTNLGLEDLDGDGESEPVWSDAQRISWAAEGGGQVAWFANPGSPEQKRVVWGRSVPEFGAGEVPNGVDDDGDGLIDETGLAFVKEGKSVRILLSMRAPDGAGGTVDRQLEALVTCRN